MYGNGSGQDVRQYAEVAALGSASMTGVGRAPATPRVPLIVDQMQGMEKRLSALHEYLSNVESRLSPVLAPEPPSNEAHAKPPQHGVGLADSLVEMNGRIDYAIARLVSLVNRIEL